ncbi:hypothetical protein K5I29_03950 [Flavobacterium agricola]|uniref:Uncharacterized protein n=1 Tax=Flavobacterium agricola TaxID=2870839 RepID=A0ABY6M0L6_9FLAO|nr:hypothetical protein [Flavobacterium agricola]UYW02066.1 hypothetical protein K5I29_03950 [Flavobacterium agricola]
MIKKIIYLSICVGFCISCNQKNELVEVDELTTKIVNQPQTNPNGLELNKGEKWAVNPEMKPFVSQGEALVNAFIQEGQTDFKALADQVKQQNNQLIKSCTMTGQAHEELHKWLHPHMILVKSLNLETDTNKANALVLDLQHSYSEFYKFFD